MGLLAVILNQFEVHFVTIELNVGYNAESAAKSEVTFQSDDDTFNSLINSASSYCANPIYHCICPTTTSLARPFFSSTTSNSLLSLLIARMSIYNGFPSLRGTSRDIGPALAQRLPAVEI